MEQEPLERKSRLGYRKKKKKKRFGIAYFITALAILAATSIFATQIFSAIHRTIDSIHLNIGNRTDEEVNAIIENAQPINVLLLGIDNGAYSREEEIGRSDTMLLLSINPTTKESQLMSIPRDTYTEIVGKGTYDKINHAYAFGGAKMAIDSVEKLFDTEIDFYAEVNMAGLMSLVDAVGGVEVTSPLTFTYEDRTFEKGKTELLDGESALRFARMRYDDPEGDNGRQKRQRLVIDALTKKLMTFSSLSSYRAILEAMSQNVKTDVPINKLIALKNTYGPALENLNQIFLQEYELDLLDQTGNEIFYFYVPTTELLNKTNQIRQILNKPQVQTTQIIRERYNYDNIAIPTHY